jgi:hypothetical protein
MVRLLVMFALMAKELVAVPDALGTAPLILPHPSFHAGREAGLQVAAPRGATTRRRRAAIWDKLTSGGWVSDLYIDTPGFGMWTPSIPRC